LREIGRFEHYGSIDEYLKSSVQISGVADERVLFLTKFTIFAALLADCCHLPASVNVIAPRFGDLAACLGVENGGCLTISK
jgi:hypothetical protein